MKEYVASLIGTFEIFSTTVVCLTRNYVCSNKYYKCPGYYCINWKKVCNNIWDCPGGVEEQVCSERQSCPGQYKCHRTIICVTVYSLCDNETDCLYGDDELFCSISLRCPSKCTCLLFSVSCVSRNNSPFHDPYDYSHLVIFVRYFQISSLKSISKTFPSGMVLSLSSNALTEVCDSTMVEHFVVHFLDMSHNFIHHLASNCFIHMNRLLIINMGNNLLGEIKGHVFEHLFKLDNLDLSFNVIQILRAECFNGLRSLKELKLNGNPFPPGPSEE